MPILAIIGGDARQERMAKTFAERGYTVRTFGLANGENRSLGETVRQANAVILPVPATRDGERVPTSSGGGVPFSALLPLLDPAALLLGGMLPESWIRSFAARGGRTADYYREETVALRNALPTVEGALRLAMESLPVTLFGTRLAVVGYGRIGSLLTEKLVALGARVAVLARSPAARAAAELRGAKAFPLSGEAIRAIADCRLIFNTVPARVFRAEDLRALPSGCVLMELASASGGFDPKEAEAAGLRVIPAPALPRFYPETAGRILADAICGILENGTTL